MCQLAMLTITFLVALHVGAQPPSQEDLLQKGLAAYQNQRFDEAREHFQQLLEARPRDVQVMHNLALSLTQLNQKPLALGLWRKALSIHPGFQLAQNGRDYLEQDQNIRPFEKDRLSRWLRDSLDSLSIYELAWFLAIALAATGFFWIRYWSVRLLALEEEGPLPPPPGIALVFSVFFLLALALTGLKVNQMFTVKATVVVAKTRALSLPKDDGVSLFDLSGGNEVIVRSQIDGWAHVLNTDGSSGWVKNSELIITSGI